MDGIELQLTPEQTVEHVIYATPDGQFEPVPLIGTPYSDTLHFEIVNAVVDAGTAEVTVTFKK